MNVNRELLAFLRKQYTCDLGYDLGSGMGG